MAENRQCGDMAVTISGEERDVNSAWVLTSHLTRKSVTYRATTLLDDEKHSTVANKQRVATVVAHELAHKWFGNLVTMEWWTHLWLNKGFATWVNYLAADGLFPEWQMWTQFPKESTAGIRFDGISESHPIEVGINHASERDEIFDAVSYRKGASVIRMLQTYLAPEVFQGALAKDIKKHACSNAKTGICGLFLRRNPRSLCIN
ncbi:hypothetical protein L1987_57323 [Smallanthus sonchifolius]|uniref:Uncharacterized protein n=1 Tax=Smallanthus sonchifolius TaxID=185202 RepID=A0ACB9DCQ6_9ASTR|nr:hypothetical protein L1987_57323 [Smallanthus sonchifolius]